MSSVEVPFNNFKAFYSFYLSEHENPICRRLHFLGSCLALACLGLAVVFSQWLFLVGSLLCGYGFAWVGHFFFEKNRPATFQYPLWSFMGDWVMFVQILSGRIKI